MAKVKKMAFGGMGNIVKNVAAGAKKAVNRAAPPAQINSLSQLRSRPVMAPPTTQPVVGKKDAFYSSPEYKGFQKDSAGKPATMDVYNSPYFGSVGSGSVGRAQDAAYRKYKGIAEPTPVMGNPVMPGIKPLPPGSIGFPGGPGGKTVYNTGSMPGNVEQNYRGIPGLVNAVAPIGNIANRLTGGPAPMPIKGAPNTFAGALLGGGAAPSQPVMGNNIGKPAFGMSPATLQSGMKKGGAVKTQAKKMASGGVSSSASKRGDGIAQRGKTKGRMR